ncbi:MAG: phosphatase PAP2 family protein [Chloroflexota bacterium]
MSERARSNRASSAQPSDPKQLVGAAGAEISEAKVPERQQAARGRRFVRPYIAGLALAIAVFVALGLLAHGTTDLLRFDVPITKAIQGVHVPLYGWILTHESDLGFPPLNVVSYVVVIVGFVAVGLRLEAALVAGSSVLAGAVGGVIKHVVGRVRPTGHAVHVVGHVSGYSFPSGHVIEYVTLFGGSFYLVMVTWRGGRPRALMLVLFALLVLLVGPSRVYLGQHWPSDVLGAYLFAGVWLAGTIEAHIFLKQCMTCRGVHGRHSRLTQSP